jgi:hypothetical protein
MAALFLTSVLDGGEHSVSHPGRFTPEKERSVPIEYETGWAYSGTSKFNPYPANVKNIVNS